MNMFFPAKIHIILVCIIVGLMGAGYAVATLVNLYTIESIDYFSSEPFKAYRTIRSAAILTNSYVNTDVLNIKQIRKIAILLDLTKGSLTSVEYQVWISHDKTNWFVEATETVAAGVITDTPMYYTRTLAGNEKYFKILNCYGAYLRIAIKGTGTLTNSSATIHVMGVL